MTETDEAIQRFSEALLKPLADVGALLARAVDDLNDEVKALRRQIDTLDAAYTAHLQTMHDVRKS